MKARAKRWSARTRVLLGGIVVLAAAGAAVLVAQAGKPAAPEAAQATTRSASEAAPSQDPRAKGARAGNAEAGAAKTAARDQEQRQEGWTATLGQRREERLLQGIWWNREPIYTALSLSEAQRKKMDRRLADALESRRRAALEVRDTRAELDRALIAGEWKTADAAGERLSKAVATYSRQETRLKLAVISQLDASQRQTLAERYPAVLKRSWLLGMGRGSAERGAGRAEGRMGRRGTRRANPGTTPRGRGPGTSPGSGN